MPTARSLKRKLWLKSAAIILATSTASGAPYFLLNRSAGVTVINPIFPGVLGMFVAISLPLLVKLYSAPKIFTNDDYIKKEKEFEEAAENVIAANIDKKLFEKLFMDDLNLIPVDGIDLCTALLSQKRIKDNQELKFSILTKLARYYFNNGDYNKSITTLGAALLIRLNDVVANMRIAELYERVGLAEEAIRHYDAALTATEAPTGLKEFIAAQTRRIKAEGPNVKQPPDNFKWFIG